MTSIHPCLFCKNTYMAFWDYSTLNPLNIGFSVFCPVCLARGPKKSSKEEAIESWNEKVA